MLPTAVNLLDPTAPQVGALRDRILLRPAENAFLSGWWLGACLDTWPAASGHGVLSLDEGAAVALLGSRAVNRHGWLKVRQLGFNEALDEELDEPTMELNGFFGSAAPEFAHRFDALLRWLDQRREWDELRVPGLIEARAREVERLAERHGLRVRTDKSAQTWWVDLDRVRSAHGGDYLAALSSNTRQQIRRAHRALEREHGPLTVQAAASANEACAWLDELAHAHRVRWSAPGERSGFDIPSFQSFHRHLIHGAFAAGAVQMLRFSAGAEPFAWIYNLVIDGHVHFLMNSADYARFERFKPGMLAHRLAIEHNLAAGARLYDFLGGSQRYKASMGTDHDTQRWLVLWRPRAGLLLEDGLRRLRQRWRAMSSAAPPQG